MEEMQFKLPKQYHQSIFASLVALRSNVDVTSDELGVCFLLSRPGSPRKQSEIFICLSFWGKKWGGGGGGGIFLTQF